jgi:hypothetical protein
MTMAMKHPLGKALESMMIQNVPSYANKFFYSLGFLSMISFLVLIITGVTLVFFGSTWWLTNGLGTYVRSVHLWATQAFVLFILLHLMVVFFTSAFKKPRRLTWMLGVVMLFVVLLETEFGYILRGDYSSQWRSLQGADFYNGSGLGWWINPLNYQQILGIHIIIVPLVIIGLLFLHYVLVKVLGIAKPYRKEIQVKTVPASHKLLFVRGGVAIGLIMILALVLPSPYIQPTTIQMVAKQDAFLMRKTLVSEFDNSSDTATYVDNIAPYTFKTKVVFIDAPYSQYILTQHNATNELQVFSNEPADLQNQQLKAASDYFSQDKPGGIVPASPVISIVNALTTMAQVGLYEPALADAAHGTKYADGSTYVLRFLADTGVLADKATALNITTDQYGMVREETGPTPGAWWLTPIGLLNHTILANDSNADRDAAIFFGSLLLTMLAFPFIPYLNQLPDKLKVYRLIWREKKRK